MLDPVDLALKNLDFEVVLAMVDQKFQFYRLALEVKPELHLDVVETLGNPRDLLLSSRFKELS